MIFSTGYTLGELQTQTAVVCRGVFAKHLGTWLSGNSGWSAERVNRREEEDGEEPLKAERGKREVLPCMPPLIKPSALEEKQGEKIMSERRLEGNRRTPRSLRNLCFMAVGGALKLLCVLMESKENKEPDV